eukprot:jgi/Botrbrau1/15182/Bobra.0149s0047.1
MTHLLSSGSIDLRILEQDYLAWRGSKHISSDCVAYISTLGLTAWALYTVPGSTTLRNAGAFITVLTLSTGLGLLVYSPSTYVRYREILAASQWYCQPLLLLDKHLMLERARVNMLLSPSKGLWCVLMFKWPPFLLYSLAFPVVAIWVPYVQLVSLLMLNVSAMNALAIFGDELIAGTAMLRMCSVIENALTGCGILAKKMANVGSVYPLPTRPNVGDVASCRRYLFGLWLMLQSAVFWPTLFWNARCERKEREQFLHSLGIHGSVTWPLFKKMLVNIVGVQLLVIIFYLLFLDGPFQDFWGEP